VFIERSKSLIYAIVGGALSLPFWYVMMFGEHQPYMSLWRILFVIMMLVGFPMFFFGLVTLFARDGRGATSSTEMDIQRIRHTVETDRMTRR
jgi:hypothetical protein